ncbi:MAG TPA: hypothetical protein VGH28_00195 [Polyangiaceae bacterium]
MERRLRRTDDRNVALQYFLASQKWKLDAGALTVVDQRGTTLAGVGEIDEGRTEQPVSTMRLRAGGEWLVVSSWGGRLDFDVARGVRRILAS